jgi:steroid delta-isomerase-like uncharacterized protein
MISEQNKAIERRIVEELNKGNLAIVDELFAPDYVYHGATGVGEIRGAEAFKELMKTVYLAFPDWHMAIEEMVAEGEKVVTRAKYTGTHKGNFGSIPPTGKQFSYTGMLIARFADGREIEAWAVADLLGLLQQLGVIPPIG